MPRALLCACFTLFAVACDKRINGEPVPVFDSQVRTYALVDRDNGRLEEVGFVLPMRAIHTAEALGTPASFVLPFPVEARTGVSMDHVLLDYDPTGHAPPGVAGVPHFDVHFYMMPSYARELITCPESPVADARVPNGYIVPSGEDQSGTCVPAMGVHAINPQSPEFAGGELTRGIVFVYHLGGLVAFEPRIAVEELTSGASFWLPVPQPEEVPAMTSWPTRFEAKRDPAGTSYTLRLTDFVPLPPPQERSAAMWY